MSASISLMSLFLRVICKDGIVSQGASSKLHKEHGELALAVTYELQ